MAKKNHALLCIVGLGGAVYLFYTWNKARNQTPANPTGKSDQLPTTAISQLSTPTTAIVPVPVQSIPVQQLTAVLQPVAVAVDINGKPLPAGIDQDMYNTVYPWAIASGKAPVKTFANALIPSEYAGMYRLIKVVWPSGQNTTADTTFWNNLRTKYDPLHMWW